MGTSLLSIFLSLFLPFVSGISPEPAQTRPAHAAGDTDDAWLKEWGENVRTNSVVETCASFRETKLRPFLMDQMDPNGLATPEERRIMDASIDFIWGFYGYNHFGDRARLVEILGRTARPRFAAFVKACAEQTPARDQLVAWLGEGRFTGEDMRCVFWTLRNNFGFGSEETLARLEEAGVDEWLRLLWRIKIERDAAWGARGSGYANTVTEEGWQGFSDHGEACRAAFKSAWELHKYPEAAYLYAKLGPFDDEVFLDATAVQLDFVPFYRSFLWYNCYPRWCGSIAKMKAFAERCRETGRHDTMIPFFHAEALLKMVTDAGLDQEDYLRGHPEELEWILEATLPQIANTNAFGEIRQEAGMVAMLALSAKGDWEKAGETFRTFQHDSMPRETWKIVQDLSHRWTIWNGISGTNRGELQRIHSMFANGDYAGFLRGVEELRAHANLDRDEDTYARQIELAARMKTDFQEGKAIVASFPGDKLAWLTHDGVWGMNGSYAFQGGGYRPGSKLEWDVLAPGEFRLEIEVGPDGEREEWRFDFCQKPADRALFNAGEYPFLVLRFGKDAASAVFGEWDEVKDGGSGNPVEFPYAGGNARIEIVYRDGVASVFVDGGAEPLIETGACARTMRRIAEGKFQFNGAGARLLSMRVSKP